MPTIITKGESRRFWCLLFIILKLFCISISFSLLKIMIFIYNCQDFPGNFYKKKSEAVKLRTNLKFENFKTG